VNCLKEVFENFFRFNEILCKNPEQESSLAKNSNNYTTTHRKTIGCFFETIGCLYQLNLKHNLKEFRVRENHTNNLYWFTLKPRAISSPQKPLGKPLSNQTRLQNTIHQSSDLKPFKKHTTFGKAH